MYIAFHNSQARWTWCKGTVTDYNAQSRAPHRVAFDDGDVGWYNIDEEFQDGEAVTKVPQLACRTPPPTKLPLPRFLTTERQPPILKDSPITQEEIIIFSRATANHLQRHGFCFLDTQQLMAILAKSQSSLSSSSYCKPSLIFEQVIRSFAFVCNRWRGGEGVGWG